MFRRKVYDKLLEWKSTDEGCTALLLEGARRVGKTTVVEEFAKKEYKSYILIDFSNDLDPCKSLFDETYGSLDTLFQRLQLNSGKTLYERDSVIIFDEVQLNPRARQLIKFLVADHRYDYIETGSLISIKKNVSKIRIPSEEHKVQMHPMDFEEWLWATEQYDSMNLLKSFFENEQPLGFYAHKHMMEKYRTYMIVGGMPMVVDEFIKTNSFMAAERKKQDILNLYRDDIFKMSESQAIKIMALFEAIPVLLSSHSKTFSPGKVLPGSRSRSFTQAIQWLIEAKYVNPCYHLNDPSIVTGLSLDRSKLKMYFLDTGLLFSLSFGNDIPKLERTFKDILDDKLSINEGMFFENSVIQQVIASDKAPYFHEFSQNKKSYEIDMILVSSDGIVPVEIKSSVSTRHKSLDLFFEKHHERISSCFVIHKKDLRSDEGTDYIPIYMTGFIQ